MLNLISYRHKIGVEHSRYHADRTIDSVQSIKQSMPKVDIPIRFIRNLQCIVSGNMCPRHDDTTLPLLTSVTMRNNSVSCRTGHTVPMAIAVI